MRKSLLLAGALAFASTAFSQNVIFEDNFDSYTLDGVAAQSGDWYTWNSGDLTTDAMVTDAYAASGTQSIAIDQAAGTDLVYDTGSLTSGKYDVIFKILIPSGKEAYFNLLHNWVYTSTTGYEWSIDVYFSAAGDITWTAAGNDGGAVSFNHDEWVDIQFTVDLDADLGTLYVNGISAYYYQWSLINNTGAAGNNQLQAIDFYGYGPSGSNGLFYIDDFSFVESTSVSTPTVEATELVMFPNPANEAVNFKLAGASNAQVNIFSLDGKMVASRSLSSKNGVISVSTANLESGIYFVEIISGAERSTQKLVVRH